MTFIQKQVMVVYTQVCEDKAKKQHTARPHVKLQQQKHN